MIRKLTLAAGFGAGYVLGAKAGTARYDQIMGKARELMGQPAVQDFTSKATSTASAAADKAKASVNDTVEAVSDKVSATTDKAAATADRAAAQPAGDTVVDLGSHGASTTATTTRTTVPAPMPIVGASASGTAPDVL